MRFISWNINGIRAIVKKEFFNILDSLDAEVVCLQETKAQDEQVSTALADIEGYYLYTNSADKKGYSGTAILTRQKPLAVNNDMGIYEHDREGRIIAAEYNDFFLITVYTPNSGSELKRLNYRQQWDTDFLQYANTLKKRKPLIICGDFNVAHRDLDLARPKQNYNKSAGYMQEEIDGFNHLLNAGFIDSFRFANPEQIKYTWWSYRARARERNIGWRIDYFLTSPDLSAQIKRADILPQIMGSDHCPVVLELQI